MSALFPISVKVLACVLAMIASACQREVFAARPLSCFFVEVSAAGPGKEIMSAIESLPAIRPTDEYFELVREMPWRL
jgi:hypothetical protein